MAHKTLYDYPLPTTTDLYLDTSVIFHTVKPNNMSYIFSNLSFEYSSGCNVFIQLI